MYKKKEILCIGGILIATVLLAFLPKLLERVKEKEVTLETSVETTVETVEETKPKETTTKVVDTTPSLIQIEIKGEVTKENLKITVPYGSSYGYILSKIKNYLNAYSVVGTDLKKRYYKDTELWISSIEYDVREEPEVVEEDVVEDTKIVISKATKDELMSLYGIGEKRATSIIEYREGHTIDSWESLRSLLGVSNEVIEAIQEKAIL